MSHFNELLGYAEQVFAEHGGQIDLDGFKRILGAFKGERICVPDLSKLQRREFAKKLYQQHLPTDVINARICNQFGVSRETAWRDISKVADEVRREA